MIPILSSSQIREADQFTIAHEPITSERLMERASNAFVKRFSQIAPIGKKVIIIAGVGNNGGDAMAIARMLIEKGHQVSAFYIGKKDKASEDFNINFQRLESLTPIRHIVDEKDFPNTETNALFIEGLFGSGLSRPVEGLYAKLIDHLNETQLPIYAIDIPSGLFADKPTKAGAIIEAAATITFQTPKLAFMHPSSAHYVGDWHVVDIGLDRSFIHGQQTDFYFTSPRDINMPVRSKFDHKTSVKRAMIIAGSKGKMGAAVLSARAALRSGSGLLFVHTPCIGMPTLQQSVPEAMVQSDVHNEIVTEVDHQENVKVVAIGPGLGTNPLTKRAIADFLQKRHERIILDADAINLIAGDESLLAQLPPDTILTPHPGEFKRLVGDWEDDFHKLELLQNFCKRYKVNIVLKGAHSAVCHRSGKVYFNCTGNPGMATPGSGDVLTGIATAMAAQIEDPFEALKTAVYIHGHAGDLAAARLGAVAMNASDIIDHLPDAFTTHAKEYNQGS